MNFLSEKYARRGLTVAQVDAQLDKMAERIAIAQMNQSKHRPLSERGAKRKRKL